uniref:ATP synthase F0 subunit 8 n=1 Tax=Sebdenia flabellata TaxID=42024 RepID=A0A0E3DBE0_9FLOR|nr:ATP synthase F0 subunit 8 [Sebdenia flabellata]
MPQLDRIIVFSQIFWLFLIFTIFYTTLIHFFLPKFLKSIKSRRKIIAFNSLETAKINESLVIKQTLLQKALAKNLILIRKVLNNSLVSTLHPSKNTNFFFIDEKIGLVIFNFAKYYDTQLLNFISLYPKSLNLK